MILGKLVSLCFSLYAQSRKRHTCSSDSADPLAVLGDEPRKIRQKPTLFMTPSHQSTGVSKGQHQGGDSGAGTPSSEGSSVQISPFPINRG